MKQPLYVSRLRPAALDDEQARFQRKRRAVQRALLWQTAKNWMLLTGAGLVAGALVWTLWLDNLMENL